MNNTAMKIGIGERLMYSLLLGLAMKAVALGYITAADAPYYATGIAALLMGGYGWWVNRPSKLAKDASTAAPENSRIVITATAQATAAEKKEIHSLADAAGDKVVAKTA